MHRSTARTFFEDQVLAAAVRRLLQRRRWIGSPSLEADLFWFPGSSVRITRHVYAGDPGDKERKNAEEATHSAVRVGAYLPADNGGVRARGCQTEGGALGR